MKTQDIRVEQVVANLGGTSFLTETGLVIEGNYKAGEYAPVIYDRDSHRYLPVWKRGPAGGEEPIKRVVEDDSGAELRVVLLGVMATWVREDKRIYFDTNITGGRWFIDLSIPCSTLEEGHLFKVLEYNGLIGVLVYLDQDMLNFKAFKFRVLEKKTDPEESVTWQGNSYQKAQFEYEIDTFPAKLSTGVQAPTEISLDSRMLLENIPGYEGAIPIWHVESGDHWIVPKCLSVWSVDPEKADLVNLKWEVGGWWIVPWHFRIYCTWEGYEHIYRENFVYVEHLVYYRNNQWHSEGMVYAEALAFINSYPVWASHSEVWAEFLVNDVRYKRTTHPHESIGEADVNYGCTKMWPVMNNNGQGVAGYVCVYMTCFGKYDDGHWFFTEFHPYYWWKSAMADLRSEFDYAYWTKHAYDGPSIDGDGAVDRFMARKTSGHLEGTPPVYVYDYLTLYRILDVYYEHGENIPESKFNPGLYPYGRVAQEMFDAYRWVGLSYVPVIDIIGVDFARGWVLDRYENGILYFVYSVCTVYNFIAKVKGMADRSGETRYGVWNPEKLYYEHSKIWGGMYNRIPSNYLEFGVPIGDKLCWFGLFRKLG